MMKDGCRMKEEKLNLCGHQGQYYQKAWLIYMKHDSSLKANNSTREYTPPQTFVKPANCHADKKGEIQVTKSQ